MCCAGMSGVAGDGGASGAAYREGSGTVETQRRKRKEHASTGFYAATMRALSARFLTFYFRAPVKAFFRTRIDYMGYARAINPSVRAGESWSWRMTSPALLGHAIKQYGWGFLPNQVLPPLLANTAVGAVLYTAYLQTLGLMHEPSSYSTKRVFPPPPTSTAFAAGFVAGSIQSVLAAPLDALQIRFQATEMMEGKYKNMWQYAWRKTQEIGPRGIFAGWSLSLVKDSIGAGLFFATFETVKSQCFYSFVSTWYGDWANLSISQREKISAQRNQVAGPPEIRPHYLLEPAFIGIAGVAAAFSQALIQHPIGRMQEIQYGRLEWIDSHDHHKPGELKTKALRLYGAAYRKSWKQCLAIARREGGLRRWLFKDFFWTSAKQMPSTAAGLIAFEIIRRMYGNDDDAVRIPKDGYEIVLI